MEKKRLSKKNREFWALPKPQKRVAIAKDIIRAIQGSQLDPSSGIYFSLWSRPEKDGPLDKFLDTTKCSCCALGACFYSLVTLGDKVSINDVLSYSPTWFKTDVNNVDMRGYLREIFTPKQISLMESAFEESEGFKDSEDRSSTAKERRAAKTFGQKYKEDDERMVGIMRNIIRNHGSFIPTQLPKVKRVKKEEVTNEC